MPGYSTALSSRIRNGRSPPSLPPLGAPSSSRWWRLRCRRAPRRRTGAAARDLEAPQCATLSVPLDRSGALPGRVPLQVARLKRRRRPPDARVPLRRPRRRRHRGDARGDAAGADPRRALPRGRLRPARHRRLRACCAARSSSATCGCAAPRPAPTARSGSERARSHYATPDSVEDLEAIRADLGVERLTLFGISYGTELALAYARAHPDRVDRLILDSVVDPDDRDPFGLGRLPCDGPEPGGAVPARLPRRHRRSDRRHREARRAAAGARRCGGAPTTATAAVTAARSGRPRSPTCSTTPTTTRRCAPRCRRRCGPRCAATRRRWPAW